MADYYGNTPKKTGNGWRMATIIIVVVLATALVVGLTGWLTNGFTGYRFAQDETQEVIELPEDLDETEDGETIDTNDDEE